MIEIDLSTPRSYEVEQLSELPGTDKLAVPLIFFPPPKHRQEHDGLWLKVKPASGPGWVGVFAFGMQSSCTFSRVVSSPDPNRVCVIAKGSAYIVKADEPEVWEQIPIIPVMDVRLSFDGSLLVFSDFTTLAAYGTTGLAWRSPRLCWDGLKIVKVTRETIKGTGYDPTNSITHESRFVVDAKTGRSLLPSPPSIDGKPIW
jgi:hypothetical protein